MTKSSKSEEVNRIRQVGDKSACPPLFVHKKLHRASLMLSRWCKIFCGNWLQHWHLVCGKGMVAVTELSIMEASLKSVFCYLLSSILFVTTQQIMFHVINTKMPFSFNFHSLVKCHKHLVNTANMLYVTHHCGKQWATDCQMSCSMSILI